VGFGTTDEMLVWEMAPSIDDVMTVDVWWCHGVIATLNVQWLCGLGR
jgi:hypothetical protein